MTTTQITTTTTARRLLAAAALAALLALTGACGGEGEGDGGSGLPDAGGGAAAADGEEPSETPPVDREDAMLAFAECMREHGVDMEDPQGGRILIRGDGADPETLEAAEEACRELREAAIPEDGGGPAISPEQKQALLGMAQCMRDKGYDFEDPEFDGGGVRQRIGPGSGIDPEDPTFQAALDECRDEAGVELPRPDDEDA